MKPPSVNLIFIKKNQQGFSKKKWTLAKRPCASFYYDTLPFPYWKWKVNIGKTCNILYDGLVVICLFCKCTFGWEFSKKAFAQKKVAFVTSNFDEPCFWNLYNLHPFFYSHVVGEGRKRKRFKYNAPHWTRRPFTRVRSSEISRVVHQWKSEVATRQ